MRLGQGHSLYSAQAYITHMLRKVFGHAGFPATKFSGHSFRRSGATYAFRCGASVELISLHRDWTADAVLLYIAQPLERRLSLAKLIVQNINLQ